MLKNGQFGVFETESCLHVASLVTLTMNDAIGQESVFETESRLKMASF